MLPLIALCALISPVFGVLPLPTTKDYASIIENKKFLYNFTTTAPLFRGIYNVSDGKKVVHAGPIDTSVTFTLKCGNISVQQLYVEVIPSTGANYMCKNLRNATVPTASASSFTCELEDVMYENVFDTVSIDAGPRKEGKCAEAFNVFRSNDCPIAGSIGVDNQCSLCPYDYHEAICPGGNRVWAMPGYCVNPGLLSVQPCDPGYICESDYVWDQQTAYPIASCREGYSNIDPDGDPSSSDSQSFCCEFCAKDHRRIEDQCMYADIWASALQWTGLLLFFVFLALAATFYYGRGETVYFFPYIVQLFRLTQLVGLAALNVADECSSGDKLWNSLELLIFPPFAGLLDFYSETDHPFLRLLSQLLFTLVYLIPFLVTPLIQLIKASRNKLKEGDVNAYSSFLRAVTTWFWLMMPVLFYILLGQLPCRLQPLFWAQHLRLTYMMNYPLTSCHGAAYYVSVSIGVIVSVVLVAVLYRLVRRVMNLAKGKNPNAPLDEYLRFAFIYGSCRAECINSWVLDLPVIFSVIFMRTIALYIPDIAKVSISLTILLGAFAYVAIRRPFVHVLSNIAYNMGLISMMIGFFLRLERSCTESYFAYSEGELMGLSIAVFFFLFLSWVLELLAAFANRKSKGTVKYQGTGYVEMSEDGRAPDLTELSVMSSPGRPGIEEASEVGLESGTQGSA